MMIIEWTKMDENSIYLRTEIKGPLVDHFKAIKNHLLLTNNTEVIRTLIRKAYQDLDDAKTIHLADEGGEEQEVVDA